MEAKAREHEAKIPLSSGKQALQHAITAAECYLKAMRAATTSSDRSRLKSKFEELLSTAEKLKEEKGRHVPPPGPRSTRELPTSEKTILLRSSKLHGSIFPPWEAEPKAEFFTHDGNEKVAFSDPASFPLSKKQERIFAGWKRPLELFSTDDLPTEADTLTENLMLAKEEYDLVQDITTDCSVVASLCAAMKHLTASPKSLLSNLMFPIDRSTGRPMLSENGKYVFRMQFNGCFRQVTVDDRLPSSSTSRTLFVVDRKNPYLIWPALLEKAYLKLRGGYDFPGSNSGTDLWVLTGWIPEQIFLHTDDIELDQTWNRIKKAYDYGDVIVTLGTGRLARDDEEILGLAGEHDYAVMDVRVENGARKMLLKNPWCDGMVWKGVGSSSAREFTDGTELSALSLSDSGNNISRGTPSANGITGTFWMSFEDIVQNFESLYLNWNPSLFTHRADHHFTWTIPPPAPAEDFTHNPQYTMRPTTDGAVWILLSRHFQDGELAIARNHHSSLAECSSSLGFMSIYVFTNSGRRVELSYRPSPIHRGPFVDSPQTLHRFDARKDTTYTIAVAHANLPLPSYSFTLSFFSRAPLTIAKAQDAMAHYTEVNGSWTRRTAGGNASSPSFVNNPQFALAVPSATPLTILLAANVDDTPVHVDLVWAKGTRVAGPLAARDIVASSGEYRRGCCALTLPPTAGGSDGPRIEKGTYTAVLSTFEPGQLASFTLRIGAKVPIEIRPVPADAAGRLRTQLPPIHGGQRRRDERYRARVDVTRLTRLGLVVRSGDGGGGGSPCAVRVSLEAGSGAHARTLAVTGDSEFQNAALGLRTADVNVNAVMAGQEGLWVVLELIGGQAPAQGVHVEILSDHPVGLGPWELVDE